MLPSSQPVTTPLSDAASRTLAWWHTVMLDPLKDVQALLRRRPWGNDSTRVTLTHDPALLNPWTVMGHALTLQSCKIQHLIDRIARLGKGTTQADEFWQMHGWSTMNVQLQSPISTKMNARTVRVTQNFEDFLTDKACPPAVFNDLSLTSVLVFCEAWERLNLWQGAMPPDREEIQSALNGVCFLRERADEGVDMPRPGLDQWVERMRLWLAQSDGVSDAPEHRARL